jgi:hypothetical protein
MTERTILINWGCKCPQEIGEIPPVETKCTQAKALGKRVILGFVERCSRCDKYLGEGYGDVLDFKSREEAQEYTSKVEIGVWK